MMPPVMPLRPEPAAAPVPSRPSRRGFLAAAGVTGLALGFHVPLGPAARAAEGAAKPAEGAPPAAPQPPPNAYVLIAPDGMVTVLSAHMDGGQGIYTGIATLVAEELDADWAQMRVEGAAGNPKLYGNMAMGGAFQLTGGSTATTSSLGALLPRRGRRPLHACPGRGAGVGRARRRDPGREGCPEPPGLGP